MNNNKQSYHCNIMAEGITAAKAAELINQVDAWWATDIEGSSKNLNDVFTVHFGTTFVTFKIVTLSTNKIEWLVTDCHLPFLKDKQEWTGTTVRFEIMETGCTVQIMFTHVGLTPEVECYESCEKGWDFYAKQSLPKLLNEGKGMPNVPREAREAALATA